VIEQIVDTDSSRLKSSSPNENEFMLGRTDNNVREND